MASSVESGAKWVLSSLQRRFAAMLTGMTIVFGSTMTVVNADVEIMPVKVLYFTFDDGPSLPYTPGILNVLRKHHIHGTFFVIGNRCEESPQLIRQLAVEGHAIGIHGYRHQSVATTNAEQTLWEVEKTDEVLWKIARVHPQYYRPPYGRVSKDGEEAIRESGHTLVFWSVDSRDWAARSTSEIVKNVEDKAKPGSVVLFHDGIRESKMTAIALDILIPYFKAKGYSFETLSGRDAKYARTVMR